MSHCAHYAVSITSEDSLDTNSPPTLQRTNTLTPSSFMRQRQQHQQSPVHTPRISGNNNGGYNFRGIHSVNDTDSDSERDVGEVTEEVALADIGKRSPSPLPSRSFSLTTAGSAGNSPGASAYYCNTSRPGLTSPSIFVAAELPHRAATEESSNHHKGHKSNGAMVYAPRAMRLAPASSSTSSVSLSSLPASTPPRLQPPARSRHQLENGFSHFSVDGARVHHLPQSLANHHNRTTHRGDRKKVPASPLPARPPRCPIQAQESTSTTPSRSQPHHGGGGDVGCSPFSDVLSTSSLPLTREQDGVVDDLFTSKEFLAFMNGGCEDLTLASTLSSNTSSNSTTTRTGGCLPALFSAKEFSIPGCSSCDLSFSDSTGTILNQEAAKTFSRDGAKRSTNFGAQIL